MRVLWTERMPALSLLRLYRIGGNHQPSKCRGACVCAMFLSLALLVVHRRANTMDQRFPLDEEDTRSFGSDRLAVSRAVSPLSGAQILRRSFSNRVIVSERARLIYCPIPKIASSNWKYLIRKFEGLEDYDDLGKAHSPLTSGLRYLSDYSPEEVERLLQDRSFFKFTFVRDPYKRALSCFMDKFLNEDETYVRTEYRAFLAQLYDWRYARVVDIESAPRPSFPEFVDELAKQSPSQMNEHWMPQTLLCGFGEMPYDFVGRLENLDVDSKKVLAKVNRTDEHVPSQSEIGFPPSGASASSADDLFTLRLMMKLRLIYDVDFNSIIGA